MEISKKIPWTFWNKKIDISIFQVPKNNKIVINIHWLYGSKTSSGKYLDFAKKLQENKIANVVLFQSSRFDLENDENLSKYENKMKKFVWKTFFQELLDAKIVLEEILKNSEKYFWIKKEKLEITLNWNSLWGTLTFFLASEFSEIKNISNVWTWLRKQKWETPVIDTFPDLEIYKEKIQNFKWNFLLHQAGNDDIFSSESYEEFFKLAKNTNQKEKIFYAWVDHSFKKLNWEKSEKPYQKVYENVVKYFFGK